LGDALFDASDASPAPEMASELFEEL